MSTITIILCSLAFGMAIGFVLGLCLCTSKVDSLEGEIKKWKMIAVENINA